LGAPVQNRKWGPMPNVKWPPREQPIFLYTLAQSAQTRDFFNLEQLSVPPYEYSQPWRKREKRKKEEINLWCSSKGSRRGRRENSPQIGSNSFFKSNMEEIEILGALFRSPGCPCSETALAAVVHDLIEEKTKGRRKSRAKLGFNKIVYI
jgi:hypothetical protein